MKNKTIENKPLFDIGSTIISQSTTFEVLGPPDRFSGWVECKVLKSTMYPAGMTDKWQYSALEKGII